MIIVTHIKLRHAVLLLLVYKILVVDVRDEHGLIFTVCNKNITHLSHYRHY